VRNDGGLIKPIEQEDGTDQKTQTLLLLLLLLLLMMMTIIAKLRVPRLNGAIMVLSYPVQGIPVCRFSKTIINYQLQAEI